MRIGRNLSLRRRFNVNNSDFAAFLIRPTLACAAAADSQLVRTFEYNRPARSRMGHRINDGGLLTLGVSQEVTRTGRESMVIHK
jgi:hypothetical protein